MSEALWPQTITTSLHLLPTMAFFTRCSTAFGIMISSSYVLPLQTIPVLDPHPPEFPDLAAFTETRHVEQQRSGLADTAIPKWLLLFLLHSMKTKITVKFFFARCISWDNSERNIIPEFRYIF